MLEDMDKLVSLCKRRGFIFQSSEIYGGINGFWDYGPLGVELKRNIKDAWWRTWSQTTRRPDARRSDGRARLLDHHEPAGVGGVRPRRRLPRLRWSTAGVEEALPRRPDVRFACVFPKANHKGEPAEASAAPG